MQATNKPPEKKKGPSKLKDALARAPDKVGQAQRETLPAPLINSMEDLHLFSQAVYKSNMYAGIKNPETAMVRIQAGRELGLQPMMALNKIHVLPKGDVVIATAALGAIAMNQGVRWQILQKDAKGCKLRIYKLDGSIPEHTESFTMEDAKRADMDWKDNYVKYPEQMCFSRCLKKGLDVFDPRIGAGFYTKEEMEDVDHFKPETKGYVEKDDPGVRSIMEEEDIQDAEIVDAEEDLEDAVDEAMEESEHPAAAPRTKKPEPTPPEEDDNPEFTAELKQKEDNITEIKKRLLVLKLDPADFKLYLSEVQKTKVFVAKNQHGYWSFHSAPADAIAFLENNTQRIFRDYVNARMEHIKPGEKIGCFVKPESTDD